MPELKHGSVYSHVHKERGGKKSSFVTFIEECLVSFKYLSAGSLS